ncbi:MAG: carboxypeptidase-like regulatory domain-containing protein [Vicinamibacterales bacterium]
MLASLAFAAIPAWLTASPQRPADRPTTPGEGLIMGRVVDGTSDAAVPQAQVTLSGGGFRQVVLSDDKGRFAFFDLPAGRYAVNADLPGHCCGGVGQTTPLSRERALPLARDEKVADVVLRLWKNGAITGHVVDERGEPLVGIEVRALPVSALAGRPYVRGDAAVLARTDDRGEYRLADLALTSGWIVAVPSIALSVPQPSNGRGRSSPGTIPSAATRELLRWGLPPLSPGAANVTASGDFLLHWLGPPPPHVPDGSGVTNAYRTRFFPNGDGVAQAEQITLAPGEERSGVTFQLRPERMTRLEGTVTGVAGPLAGVTVRLAADSDAIATSGLDAAVTFTDQRGHYVFPAAPAGPMTLSVLDMPEPPGSGFGMIGGSANGIRTATLRVDPFSDAPALWARASVMLGDTPVTRLDLTARPGARVSGDLQFRGSRPPPAGVALTRVSLSVERVDGLPLAEAFFSEARVNASGEFRSVGLPPGRYVIRASAPRLDGWWPAGVELDGRDVMLHPIELGDADLGDVVVILSDTPASIAGTVRTPRGSPVPAAVVAVFPVNAAMWVDFGRSTPHFVNASTADDGSFTIPSLPPGDYYAAAAPADLTRDWRQAAVLRGLASTATRITVRTGLQTSVALTTAGGR